MEHAGFEGRGQGRAFRAGRGRTVRSATAVKCRGSLCKGSMLLAQTASTESLLECTVSRGARGSTSSYCTTGLLQGLQAVPHPEGAAWHGSMPKNLTPLLPVRYLRIPWSIHPLSLAVTPRSESRSAKVRKLSQGFNLARTILSENPI